MRGDKKIANISTKPIKVEIILGDITIREAITHSELLPVCFLFDRERRKEIESSGKYPMINIKELEEGIKELRVPYDWIYLSTNPYYPLVLIKDFIYLDILSININQLKAMGLEKKIEAHISYMDNLLEEGKYLSILKNTPKNYRLSVFCELYKDIPELDRYSLFKYVYTSIEYGFEHIPQQLIKELLTNKSGGGLSAEPSTDNFGYVEIYRGVGSGSRSVLESYSWTTEKNVAKSFANRFFESGELYRGKVHIEHVIDYILDRNEYEVWVNPENIIELEKVKDSV